MYSGILTARTSSYLWLYFFEVRIILKVKQGKGTTPQRALKYSSIIEHKTNV